MVEEVVEGEEEEALTRSRVFEHAASQTQTTMSEIGGPEEAPRLWRVNRTVHELVKDRVCELRDLQSALG